MGRLGPPRLNSRPSAIGFFKIRPQPSPATRLTLFRYFGFSVFQLFHLPSPAHALYLLGKS